MKVHWFNFLEGDDGPWVYSDGMLSVFPELDTKFEFAMEKNMDEFDESITTDDKMITWMAKYNSVPEEEIANIKFAMGYIVGGGETGDVLSWSTLETGTNGEVALADRYAVFYKNGDLHCGMLKQLKLFKLGPFEFL